MLVLLNAATVNPPSTLTMSRVRGKGLLTGRIMGDAKAARRAKKERERLAREREQRSHEEDFSMIWSSNRHQQQQCEHRLDLQEQQPLLEEGVRSVNQVCYLSLSWRRRCCYVVMVRAFCSMYSVNDTDIRACVVALS